MNKSTESARVLMHPCGDDYKEVVFFTDGNADGTFWIRKDVVDTEARNILRQCGFDKFWVVESDS